MQPTISCLNGHQEQETKPLTAFVDWSNYQTIPMPQSGYSQLPIQMDQHSILKVKYHKNTKQPRTQDLQTPYPSTNPTTSELTTVEIIQDIMPKPLTIERHDALLQMQRTDPFCKCISKRLSNNKAPQYEADLFIHFKGLLYKHIMDANQTF